MLITAKMNREFGACYTDELLAELYGPEGKTYEEVATLRDGKWVDVRLAHRVWILQRVLLRLNRPGWLEYLARLTERVLARVPKPDPRSVAVVTALRANAVTQEMVAAAYVAVAYAAVAYAAAAAAYAVSARAAAARAAVAYAARAAARAAAAAASAAYAVIEADADRASAAYAADAASAVIEADAEWQTQLKDLVSLLEGHE